MQNVEVKDTRNFALIGHAGDGKTSLGEALLHTAGATATLGKVDDGSSVLNHLPEENDGHHTHTISSHLYAFDWSGKHITLVDTPGDPNFAGDSQIAVQALDGAVLLVSAVDGAKVGTEKMWRTAREAGIPVVAFVNGVDRERADFEAAVESLRGLDANPVVLAMPMGTNSNLSGVVDLIRMKAVNDEGESDVPAAWKEEAEAQRMALVEAVAECDDALLERYLEEGALDDDAVFAGLAEGVRTGQLLPVLCGSATSEVGVQLALREFLDLLPSPAGHEFTGTDVDGGDEHPVAPDPKAPFSAVVFKTQIDRYAGTMSVLRVVSGTVHADTSVLNATTGNKTRLGKLLLLHGAKHEDVAEAGPGDVIAVAKLKNVHTGNVLTAEKGGVHLPEPTIPQGVLSYAISAKTQGDEDKVYASLGRLVEEDPTLHLGREASTGEFLLTGMGELHIRTTVQKLKRMFDVEVELKTPKVPYRETIVRKVENVEGKLKKQSGGKGMFGVCYLTVEPLPRGSGIEFVDEIVGGAIPRGLIPAVEKGVSEACQHGPLTGNPVVDVRVRCIDGKHHSVDSNEMAFKLAGSFGFKAALEQAKPTLLEPIMNVEISVPDEHVGDIMGDVAGRRGRVQSSEAKGHTAVVVAQIPMAEMLEYASSLTSLTGGKGAFHMEFAHYDEVPAAVREKVIEEARKSERTDG
ncbi:MAG: elongation factor G [Proteobacteria bacterium]|nr:elongation factor G [Pseudomonadota bacterium]